MDEREALLAALRDPVPPEVGWWPLAPGWWIVAALVALVAAGIAFAWRRRARSRAAFAWRRAARAELATLRARLDESPPVPPGSIVAEASVLARRAVLAVRSRAEVASLSGEAWLETLDAASGGERFTNGAGRLLARGPYERAPEATPDELAALLDALEALVGNATKDKSGDGTGAPLVAHPTDAAFIDAPSTPVREGRS